MSSDIDANIDDITNIFNQLAARSLIFRDPITLAVMDEEYREATSRPVIAPVLTSRGVIGGLFLNLATKSDARTQILIGNFRPGDGKTIESSDDEPRILYRTYPADNSCDGTYANWGHFTLDSLTDVQQRIAPSDDTYVNQAGELLITSSARRELFDRMWSGLLDGTVTRAGEAYQLGGQNYTFARAAVHLMSVLKTKINS